MIEKNQTTTPINPSSDQHLLNEILASNQEIRRELDFIHRHIKHSVLWGYARFALIVIPIILSLIYLPPVVKEIWSLVGLVR